MMKPAVLVLSVLALPLSLLAEVTLPRIIDHHMILQRGVPASIWGWAEPGEKVTVEFAGQSHSTGADTQSFWKVELSPMEASAEGRSLIIRGQNDIILEDVLVGEVWLASGQSNMEWALHAIAPEERQYALTRITNAQVRAFHAYANIRSKFPLPDGEARWRMGAEMAKHPTPSAVGIFFALKLHDELGVPVAILDATWGGQHIEAFIPAEGYQAMGLKMYRPSVEADPAQVALDLRAIVNELQAMAKKADRGQIVYSRLGIDFGDADNGVYNAMIAPMTNYALRGAIWYQGEANRSSLDYFEKLQALSAGWSQVFGMKDIPILQVQIAPYNYTGQAEGNTMLCDRVWAAQYRAADEIPGVEVVAIYDTDIPINNLHPQRKRPVGERLAAVALQKQYGREGISSGPRVAQAVLTNGIVKVSFSDIDQGLSTRDGQAPTWFELSEDGEAYMQADAVLDGNVVVVSSPEVTSPQFIRMGWNEIALPNLQDRNGWPVFAFDALPVEGAVVPPLSGIETH